MPLTPAQDRAISIARHAIVDPANDRLDGLPEWVDWARLKTQAPIIRDILHDFEDVDVVVLDAPTGSGKTLIAECVRRMLPASRSIYTCTTIALQHQFTSDFQYAKLLKGRANYPTLLGEMGSYGVTCADCTFTHSETVEVVDDESGEVVGEEVTYPCEWCKDKRVCPYEVAKQDALAADLSVLNVQYLLTEGNGPGKFRGRELVIVDECDMLESELMQYVSVEISQRRKRWLGLWAPEKVTVPSSWKEWIDYALQIIADMQRTIAPVDTQSRRDFKYVADLAANLRRIQPQIEEGWVYTGSARKDQPGNICFRPVKVDEAARRILWPLGRKWLLMSATPISAVAMVRDDLGYEGGMRTVTMPSTFPTANRPVYVQPAANMSKSRMEDERPKLLQSIEDIIHSNADNVLIHTVSYHLADWLYKELDRLRWDNIYTYTSSREKQDVVEGFKQNGGVLIAPSLERGVDLPDDLCNIIIVAKIPFPNLGDRQISARLHSPGGQQWYDVQAVRALVQMCGRGVRHENDTARTYILDSQFDRLWNSSRRLFPRWWVEALQWKRG